MTPPVSKTPVTLSVTDDQGPKHGWAGCPQARPYSGFHRWVRTGVHAPDGVCRCHARRVAPPRFGDIDGLAGEYKTVRRGTHATRLALR